MTRINELVVGIVFFAAMIVLGYFTIIKGDFFDSRQYYPATIIFEDVEGLEVGDKVLVNGVDAGVVLKLQLLEDNRVKIFVNLFRKFNLYSNYKILLKNQTALGGRVVVVFPGKAEVENQYFDLVYNYENLKGTTVGDPLTMVAQLIDDNRENLSAAIKNIRDFTDKINRGKGTLGKLINDDTIHSETSKMISELRDTIEDSREQAPITSFIRAALTAF